VKIYADAPKINHLFYTDDSLIVMKATVQCAKKLNEILEIYESQLGQMINKGKSSTFFSKATRYITKRGVVNEMEIPKESQNRRYLGLPVHLGTSKSREFKYLKEKIWKHIQGWKEHLLSKVGKEILMKVVAQAISTYAMLCFSLTKKLSSMICRYWWS
jgi:hypothetical protein